MAWRGLAVVTAVFIAISAPLASRPSTTCRLLQWTTGHARVPVQGFSHLMGRDGVLRKFTLTSLELTQAVYPRAHTCFNRIDVPLYRTKEELVAGFEFVLELGDQTFTMD